MREIDRVGGRLRHGHGQSLSRFDVLAQLARRGGERVAIGELARLFTAMAGDQARWVDAALVGMSDADKTRLVDLLVTVRRRFEADAAPRDGQDP